MYLHDYGDEAASFSKEEIQQGFVFFDKNWYIFSPGLFYSYCLIWLSTSVSSI